MTLNATYWLASEYLFNGSLVEAAAEVYSAAIPGEWFWLMLLMFFSIIVFLKTQNIGLVGVVTGILAWFFVEIGHFPTALHWPAYLIMGLSFGLTIFLFYTERDRG
jgi:hypothetical protein